LVMDPCGETDGLRFALSRMQRMCQWQWNARLTAWEQSKDSPAHEVSRTAPMKAMPDPGADEV